MSLVLQGLPATEDRIEEIKQQQAADTTCQQIVQYCQSTLLPNGGGIHSGTGYAFAWEPDRNPQVASSNGATEDPHRPPGHYQVLR